MKFIKKHIKTLCVFLGIFVFYTFIVFLSLYSNNQLYVLTPFNTFFYFLSIAIISSIGAGIFHLFQLKAAKNKKKYLEEKLKFSQNNISNNFTTNNSTVNNTVEIKSDNNISNINANSEEEQAPEEKTFDTHIDYLDYINITVNGKKLDLTSDDYEDDADEEDYTYQPNYPLYNSFVAIDFETATNEYRSACSLGLVKVVNNQVVSEEYYVFQPPENKYFKDNILIHNITPEMTENLETFPSVWNKIKHHFENNYIVAHNAIFDMSVLKATLDFYNIDMPEFWYFDSIPASSTYCKGVGRKLNERCEFLNIPLEHHNALFDAKGCAQLVLYSLNKVNIAINELVINKKLLHSFSDIILKETYNFGNKSHKSEITVKEVTSNIDEDEIEENDYISGKTFVFTGQLAHFTREEAFEEVLLNGGYVKDNVSKKVDYLVNTNSRQTTKVKKALEQQEKGHHIQIINERQFLAMLDN